MKGKMNDDLLMGIDVGTQSTRVALLDLAGNLVASSSLGQELFTPYPGWAEQDPSIWWRNVVRNIRKILKNPSIPKERIAAIGVCGQMHGTVPLDKDGRLLSQAVQLWCDKRCAAQALSLVESQFVERAYQITGNPPVASWVGFKIQWLQEHHPDIYLKTWKFVIPKDYINFKLTGEAVMDPSEASGSYLMDSETVDWSDELLEIFGFNKSKLPKIVPSARIIGNVTQEAAMLTGLPQGIPVVAGGGDMLCMLLAAGITRPGYASDVTGTSGIFSVFTRRPVLDKRLMNLHHVIPGWIPFGIIDSGGGSLKWFKDEFCQEEVRKAKRKRINVYDLLNELANQVDPGAEGLLFFPYLMGERTLGTAYARGVFFGLTPRSGKGYLVRAIMEGVTFELRRTLEIVEAAGYPVDRIVHNGGGAYSELWSQIKADIYQKPVITFENSEGGILGAAILAGVGIGIYEDPASGAEKILHTKKIFYPREAYLSRYDAQYQVYTDLHDKMQASFNTLYADNSRKNL
jgi:xylulokinase